MVNVWPNSTFEASTEPWQANAGSDTPVLSSEHAHGGARSMHAMRGAGTTNTYARADLDANGLTTTGTYTITAWLWIPSTVGTGSHGLRVTGSGVAIVNLYTGVRDDWAEVTGEFTWDGVGSAALDIYGSTTTSEMWIDDLTIDDGTEPPEPVPGSGIGCTVYTRPTGTGDDLVRLADGSPTDNPLAPNVLSDLKITWGRETTLDQPAASTCSFQLVDPPGGSSFTTALGLGVPVVVTATPPATTDPSLPVEEVAVFTGRVTSLKHAWDDTAAAPVVAVDAADFTADLEGTIVGDEPWLAESLESRFGRIAALTTLNEWSIAQTLAPTTITYRDVDAQGAMGLLAELASTADGALWSASSTDGITRLILEDPSERSATSGLVALSACDIVQDGVEWIQDVQDVITRVSVTWFEQNAVGSEEKTTEKTVTQTIGWRQTRYGRRTLALSSQLTTADKAREVAQKILARTPPGNWRITGLTVDDALYDPGSRTPGRTLTNYVPDPSGEYDGITWTGTTTPYRRDNDSRTAHTGNACYDFYTDDANTAITVEVPQWATSVTVSAWYRLNTGSSPITYQLRVTGTGVTTTTSPVYTADSSTYQFHSLTASVTGGGTINFYPAYNAKMNSGYRLQVDDFGIAFDTEPADFSGDTPLTDDYVHAWSGTPGASPSIRLDRGSSEEYASMLLTLLNNNARNGLAIQLVDMPTWTVTRNNVVHLEGGSYTFTAGAWLLDLTVSNPPPA